MLLKTHCAGSTTQFREDGVKVSTSITTKVNSFFNEDSYVEKVGIFNFSY